MEIFRLFGSIFVKDEASKSLDKVNKKADETSDKIKKSEGNFQKVSNGLNKVGGNMMKFVAAPLTALGTGAIKASSDFQGGMAKVSTIADTTKVPLNKLSEGALKLSKDFGVGASEITESMYQAISASVPTEKAVNFVAVATKAAKGGFTDAATAVDGLSTVLNSYGIEADKADKIATQMLITQNKGKTTFGELASSVGKVTPIASQLGIKTEELFSSLASTTAQGLATSESVTALKAAMSNIIKPSKDASDAAELLGIEFNASALKSKGWKNFLLEIKDAMKNSDPVVKQLSDTMDENAGKMMKLSAAGKENTSEYKKLYKTQCELREDMLNLAEAQDSPLSGFAKMFGSVEGLNSVLMLTSDNGMNIYNDTMKEMETNATALDDAFNKMSNAPGEKFKKSLNSMKVAAIQFGDVLAPVFEKVTGTIQWFGDKLSSLTPEQKKFIVTMAKMAVGISAFVFAVGKIMQAIIFFNNFKKAIAGVQIAGKALSMGTLGWIGIIVAGVAMLVAFIISHWDQIKQITIKVFTAIGDFLSGVWKGIKDVISKAINSIKTVITTVFGAIKTFITTVWEGISTFFSTIWEGIKTIFTVAFLAIRFIIETAFTIIVTIIRVPLEFIKSLFETIWNAIGDTVMGALNGIRDFFVGIWNGIVDFFTGILNAIKGKITEQIMWQDSAWNKLKGIVTDIWNGIKDAIMLVVDKIKDIVTTAWNFLLDITMTVFNAIKDFILKVWDGIKIIVTTVVNAIKTVVTTAWNIIKTITTTIWNGIKAVILGVWNGIKTVITTVVNVIKTIITNTWNGIKSVTTTVWNGIKTAMTKPIEGAKNVISGIIEKIKGFFTKLKLKFPKIEMPKLPHFKLSGKFSLKEMSVPKLKVDWYSEGGIFTSPTVMGGIGVGDANRGFGHNAEAVLPLNVLWDKLDKNFNKLASELKNKENNTPFIINVENMNVRSENDIKAIAEELEFYRKQNNLGKGGAY